MRFLLLLLISVPCLVSASKPLFENTELYQWYEELYDFQPVDLNSEKLKHLSPLEKDFAALNYHWREILSKHDGQIHRRAIHDLSHTYLNGQKEPVQCSDQELFMAVIASSFEARVLMLESSKWSSARAYFKAVPYLERILKKRDSYEEFRLLANIYDACLNEVEGRLTYLPLLMLLPEKRSEEAYYYLLNSDFDNTICKIESRYFAFKIAANLKEDPQEALDQLEALIAILPNNPVLRIERVKLAQQGSLPQVEAGDDLERILAKLPPTKSSYFRSLLTSF